MEATLIAPIFISSPPDLQVIESEAPPRDFSELNRTNHTSSWPACPHRSAIQILSDLGIDLDQVDRQNQEAWQRHQRVFGASNNFHSLTT